MKWWLQAEPLVVQVGLLVEQVGGYVVCVHCWWKEHEHEKLAEDDRQFEQHLQQSSAGQVEVVPSSFALFVAWHDFEVRSVAVAAAVDHMKAEHVLSLIHI